ncbi:hypothetical protein FDN13_01345 [Caloramator sp. E03]|uniref:hypothetical protein n=1 Tax=Caloramator sp. E03 TaxID=2576307 RepID=UPI00111063EF|nr:hypothetical protein [Caloramator sp. E03]QCX32449.1 hypothetical protein FDN13_01345 [Caloramator sp. E03]
MYQVTEDFLNKVKANERRIYAKCQIDYTDPFLDQSIQCTANEQANVSYPAQTADAVTEPVGKIASLDGTWVLGEDWVLAPGADEIETKQMGWWGSQLAGADGSFTAHYPTLTVTFFSRPITQLKVVGDSKRDEYPVDFDINLYDTNGTILYTETVTDNTQVVWQNTLANPVTQVTKMDLIVKKWSHPGRQVKILEFFTSIQEVYEGDDILLIHLLEEREVSQGSLPVGNISSNEIDIRLNNASRKFDAGNKQSSLYQLLKQNRRIKAWLGLKGDGDGVNIQQSVDFNQGTLNNLIVVNNKLQLPSVDAPTFSRNSIAYLSDGTLVNSNLPRFEQGAFAGDKALMIEEGTTNSIKYPLEPDIYDTSSWSIQLLDNYTVKVTVLKDNPTPISQYQAFLFKTKDNTLIPANTPCTLSCIIEENTNPYLFVKCIGFGSIQEGVYGSINNFYWRTITHTTDWHYTLGLHSYDYSKIKAGDYIILKNLQVEKNHILPAL